MSQLLGRVATWAVLRPRPIVAATIFVAVIGGVLAAGRLSPDAGTDTLLDSGSPAFEGTERFKERFGDDAVVVLVKGDLEGDLGRLLGLEGCLSGRAPADQGPADGPCRELAELDPVRVVYGPATFLNQSAVQASQFVDEQARVALEDARVAGEHAAATAAEGGASATEQAQASEDASAAVLAQYGAEALALANEFGQTGLPRIDDPAFVSAIVFDRRRSDGTPKARFSYLFPNSEAALISVRLRPELDDETRRRSIALIREAVDEERFRLDGGTYVISGVPVVLEGLADELVGETLIALGLALLVMAVVLLLIFSGPLRLLPLAIALAASGLAFGLLAVLGGSLTMASVAVLPVLIGLAVDYSIQLNARFTEAQERGLTPARAAVAAAVVGGPVIGTAATATAAGFAVLFFSPVPMVRAFGLMLVAGIGFAFLIAMTAGLGAVSLASQREQDRRAGTGRPPPARPRGMRVPDGIRRRLVALGEGMRGPVETAKRRLRDWAKRALAVSIGAPVRVLVVATVLAALGWALGTRTEVVSEVRELVPADLPALESVDELQAATGVSGEVDVLVSAPDLTDPEVIVWMREYRSRVLERNGFAGDFPDCRAAETEICPAIALPDLFASDATPTRREVASVLRAVPEYFSQAVISPAGEGTDPVASIAFGIPEMPLADQKQLIDDLRAQVNPPDAPGPPPGVEAEIVGLPVLAGDANEELSGSRYWLTLFGLLAVALVLLAVYRSFGRALVPLIPIAFATGWSALILAVIGIPLNPMSATLGVLVIAIGTEFSVILSARFHEERAGGRSLGEALRVTYSRTGVAVLASGITAIAGFAVLTTSGITMLRDFGFVTVVDLAVALAGVMFVLPAALAWAEGGFRPFNRSKGPGRQSRGAAASMACEVP